VFSDTACLIVYFVVRRICLFYFL